AVFFCLLGSAAAFAPAAMRPAVTRPTMAAPVQMSLDPVTAADSASHATQLLALALPIPQFNPAKARASHSRQGAIFLSMDALLGP
ncbi:hypothetical protein EMIHUDRAFT_374385, partial [Emiliania huxleyi CCMP1516]|uniref:Uncharacterized protein n=2 Tax=Emiliania huxleyi TaxID=2903 RepID=A0A0D3IF99_EMIH1